MNAISFLVKNIIPVIFYKNNFLVNIDDVKFYTSPRTDHLFVLWETWIKKDYVPKIELKDIKIIVDIGAHIGDFSIWSAKNFNPNKIIAIEPSIDLHDLLVKNIEVNELSQLIHPTYAAIYSSNTKLNLKKVH